MARFFNEKIKKGRGTQKYDANKTVIVAIVVILVVIAFIVLISVFKNTGHSDAVIKIRDKVAVEINENIEDKSIFFTELENVKDNQIEINYSKVSFSKLGTYDVIIKIFNKEYSSKIEVIDTENPILVTKEVHIDEGEIYEAKDFVKECKDNSKENCIIEFYDSAVDNNGNNLNYSTFTDSGTYTVEIVAKDESGNKTNPQKATLVIGDGKTNPEVCQYGNNEYDTSNILSVDVTTNGCAVDLNLYKSETMLKPVNELINAETEKLKKEFSKINLGVDNIHVDSNVTTIINKSGDGVVGYTLKIKVSINDGEVIEEYYLNASGAREYIINKYL